MAKEKKEQNTDGWQDEALGKEPDRRNNDMESGKDPGITWPEAKKQLLQRGKFQYSKNRLLR